MQVQGSGLEPGDFVYGVADLRLHHCCCPYCRARVARWLEMRYGEEATPIPESSPPDWASPDLLWLEGPLFHDDTNVRRTAWAAGRVARQQHDRVLGYPGQGEGRRVRARALPRPSLPAPSVSRRPDLRPFRCPRPGDDVLLL
jgi:hypothetical protein